MKCLDRFSRFLVFRLPVLLSKSECEVLWAWYEWWGVEGIVDPRP